MEWIEVTGETLEEAKELALDRLGVAEDDLEIEIVTEPKSGFLGMGRADARIRARVKPLSREKPDSRRRRRSSRGSRDRDRDQRGSTSEESKSRSGRTKKQAGSKAGRSGSGNGNQARDASRRAKSDAAREASMSDDEVSLEEQCASARVFLEGVVDALELDATVSASPGEERVEAAIDGQELGRLIGPGAATLTALEELTQAVVQSKSGGHGSRVRLDVCGYRERRREALEDFTRRQAEQVAETGSEVVLEPMGSPDRKVVHDVIAELDGVSTTSEGEEPRRRVVIRPAGD